jgi:hypothetical protein
LCYISQWNILSDLSRSVAVVFPSSLLIKLKLTILLELFHNGVCGALGTLVGVFLMMVAVVGEARSSGYRVFSIAAWAMGASSAFHLEENLWD